MELDSWNNGEALADGSYVYIELSYRDGNEFTIYQNLDSFGPRRITGVYNLSTDESLGSVIRGMYDYENGDWNHRYIIRNLFSDRMTWIATDDAQNVSVYKRCPGVPQEILDAYKDEIEAEESENRPNRTPLRQMRPAAHPAQAIPRRGATCMHVAPRFFRGRPIALTGQFSRPRIALSEFLINFALWKPKRSKSF